MSQGAQDELLPWVVGGVLVIALTIAVAAVAGSGDNRVIPGAGQETDQRAISANADSSSPRERQDQ